MATRMIGLDLGTTTIRAAEVEVTGRTGTSGIAGTLVKFVQAPMPPGAVVDGDVHETQTVASALKQLWSKGGLSTKDVIVGVGNARTVVREITLAELPMSDLRKSLPFQVEEFLPMSTDEALLDFFPTAQVDGEHGTQLRGIMVAAAKSSVSGVIMAIESAGLRPKVVDLNAFAMVRALTHGEWGQRTVALVDIGARTTHVVIVQDGQPRLVRMLASGGNEVTEAVASAMQLPNAEADRIKRETGVAVNSGPQQNLAVDAIATTSKALVDAIRNTMVYYAGNNPGAQIQHVLLTGGGSHLPGLGQLLASACRLPVSFGEGLGGLKMSKKAQAASQGYESMMSIPVGLAMGEVAK